MVIQFALCLAGALACWGLWLGEVCWVTGWGGLAWVSGFRWSALPICALIVVMSSYVVTAHADLSGRAMFAASGFVITIVAFVIARWAAFELFSSGIPGRAELRDALALLVAGLVVSGSLPALVNRWLAPLYPWAGMLVGVGLVLVLPLSFATIKVFPALNGATDLIHSIKMGYPVFWTAVFVPLALRLGRKRRADIADSGWPKRFSSRSTPAGPPASRAVRRGLHEAFLER